MADLLLQSFSDELLGALLSWLPLRAIGRCASVCRTWRGVPTTFAAQLRALRLRLHASTAESLLRLERREAWRHAVREVAAFPSAISGNGLALLDAGGGWVVSKAHGLDGRKVGMYPQRGGAQSRALEGHEADIMAVAADSREGRLVSGDIHGELRVWDARTGACIATVQSGGLVFAVALRGEAVASGGEEKLARLHWWRSGALARAFPADGDVEGLALSGDRLAFVDGSGRTAAVCSVEGGKLRSWSHPASTLAVALQAASARAWTGCADKLVRCFCLDTGECLRVLAGHQDAVNGLSLAGDVLASVGFRDKIACLWSASSGEALTSLSINGMGIVYAVSLSLQQGIIAVADYDGGNTDGSKIRVFRPLDYP
ncbi:hypothetical protein AB1Y20_011733 [Prymnesium parvum]|uniref:F-box domain-containing protein n=1 Tax=Prymnesium parvum TaxID=97485 RepID=A0AB34IJX5_PRYPA